MKKETEDAKMWDDLRKKTSLQRVKSELRKQTSIEGDVHLLVDAVCIAILKDDEKNESYSTIRRYEKMIENIKKGIK